MTRAVDAFGRYRVCPQIVVVHGESGSVFHVVDPDAPEGEQPAILSSHTRRADAERNMVILSGVCG